MGRHKNIVYNKDDIKKLTKDDKVKVNKKSKKEAKEEEVVIEDTEKNGIVVDLYEQPSESLNETKCLVSLVTSQCPPIKTLFETLNGILSNINLYFTPEGIFIRALNRDETINVNAELLCDRFEYYHCKKDEHIVGIRLVSFYKIISTLGANNVLTMYVDENSPERLSTRIEIKERNTIHNYTINRLNIKVLRLDPIDSDDYPVIIEMPSNYFQKICRDANRLVDKVEITYSTDNQLFLRFETDGIIQETTIGENKDYLKFIKNEKTEEIIQGVYNLKDLVSFSKCTSISDSVKLHLSNEHPFMIQYKIGNLGVIKLFMDDATPETIIEETEE